MVLDLVLSEAGSCSTGTATGHVEALSVLQLRDNGGLDCVGSAGSGEKWSDYGLFWQDLLMD